MSKMNRYLMILLVLQAVILLAGQMISTQKPVQKERKLFPGLKADDITYVEVQGEGQNDRVKLELRGKEWVLGSHGGYPVKKDSITGFLGNLIGLTAKSPVVTKLENHRSLDVSNSKFVRKVTISRKEGKPYVFYLGSSPGIKKVHFRFEGENDVYLVSDLSSYDVGATPSNWISTEYFKVDRDQIVGVSIKNSEGQFDLRKDSNGGWISNTPLPSGKSIDASKIDGLLGSLQSISMKEPVSRSVEERFGLNQPLATLTIVTEKTKKEAESKDSAPKQEAERTTYTLMIGAKDKEDYFMQSSTSPFVVRVNTWAVDSIMKKKLSDLFETPKTDAAKTTEPKKEG